jgi:putative ABC transport system permease protein
VLPLLLALRPIWRAANMTTREALHDVAMVAPRPSGRSRFRVLRTRTGRLMTLGVANALRVRGRFVLVTATLALGGALFLSALNLGRAFHDTLAVNYSTMEFDILLGVGDESPDSIEAMLQPVPGIASVEASRRARVNLAGPPATGAGSPMTHGSDAFTLNAARGGATPPSLALTKGRWLRDDDQHAVVANHVWMAGHPQMAVGDSIALRIAGDSSRWLLAGEVREVMAGPALYASSRAVEDATSGKSRGTQVRIVTKDHDLDAVKQVMTSIDRRLAEQGIEVAGMQSIQNVRKGREDHVVMIINFLLAIATLSLIVGGLGLATMLSVAIFERSQEIGVMRAVGATRSQLLVLIVVEGAWIAFVGWLGSIVIALPATYALDVAFGRMMLGMPLVYVVSATAIPALAAVSGVIALIASGVPAWRASLLEPRELLVTV